MAEAMFNTTVTHLPTIIIIYILTVVVPSDAWKKHVLLIVYMYMTAAVYFTDYTQPLD